MTIQYDSNATLEFRPVPLQLFESGAIPCPSPLIPLQRTSEPSGDPIHDKLDESRDRSREFPNYSNFTPDSLASPRLHASPNRKCYAPPTPSGTPRVSSASPASAEDARDHDQTGSYVEQQTTTMDPRMERNLDLPYNSIPLLAPVPKAPSRHPALGTAEGGLLLNVAHVPEPTIHLLQQMARDEERSWGDETSYLYSLDPPQSRYSARLRGVAPPPLPLSASSSNYPFTPSNHERSPSPLAPANRVGATDATSAEEMNEEPPIEDTVASMLPPLSAIDATVANPFVALPAQVVSPVQLQDRTSVLNAAVRRIISPPSYSPAYPPPLARRRPLELTPQVSEHSYVAHGLGLVEEGYYGADMRYGSVPVAGPSTYRTSPVDSVDTMALLRAPTRQQAQLPSESEDSERLRLSHMQATAERCYQGVENIRLAMGVSQRHTIEVDALCISLRNVLHRIREALPGVPLELKGELLGEELGRQWWQKHDRVTDSLLKHLCYFDLLEQQVGCRTPRLHKVDSHLEKLWAYVAKFEDLVGRLEHYQDRLPRLQLKLQYAAMHRAANEELSAERQRRHEWRTQWNHERQQRKDLRDEIRRMRGTSRPTRR
ncbi:hypothetical protein EIP91_006532 [Steccherinum ochraceum]|uniref:Uncharacterized protein n=1 Tax=Steccherinum ochraceum TaxID=92696 RepID=A0A4V2MVN6_9APHY|nr:hypothetical protein EIP91_006532 [Steccherinum ochraceum]